MSKKIYISPIMTSDCYQLQTEMICCSPSCSCGCGEGDFCICDEDFQGPVEGDVPAQARYRANYSTSTSEAEFGNLW